MEWAVAVRHSRTVQQLSSATRRTESCPGVIGPISPEVKQMGARSAGNPHAAHDVEGAGNVARSGCLGQLARQSSTLRPRKPQKLTGTRTFGMAPPMVERGQVMYYAKPTSAMKRAMAWAGG